MSRKEEIWSGEGNLEWDPSTFCCLDILETNLGDLFSVLKRLGSLELGNAVGGKGGGGPPPGPPPPFFATSWQMQLDFGLLKNPLFCFLVVGNAGGVHNHHLQRGTDSPFNKLKSYSS